MPAPIHAWQFPICGSRLADYPRPCRKDFPFYVTHLLFGFALRITAVLATGDIRVSRSGGSPPEVITTALATAVEMKGLPYVFGGNGLKDGGFDCSGAMYYILHKVGLKPPRTSSDQYLWVKENSELHPISESLRIRRTRVSRILNREILSSGLEPMFPTDGRTTKITHVGMFLGYEKKDGRPVMINATNGRSYRGKKGNGFGVLISGCPLRQANPGWSVMAPPGLLTLRL